MSEQRTHADVTTVQNYIDGEWQTPSAEGQGVHNPGTGEAVGYVGFSTETDIDAAVAAAQEAFSTWRSTDVETRIQPMFQLKNLLEDHQEELAEVLVTEHGKTLSEARGELRRGIENVEVACGIPSMMQAGTLPNAAPDIDESAVRKPLGVFTAITPFNFPGMIPLWFLPYAVATGNAFILKPSEQTPIVAQRIVELVERTELPDGIVQLVHGGPDTVNGLLEHPDIAGVSFVGSTPIAKHVYESAAAHGKRVQAQGGAKNHIIVTESADLEFAAEQTVSSACACAGERCLANDVVIVEESVYDDFTARVLEAASNQTVGYGLDEETDIGALITAEHETSVEKAIESAIQEGATLALDGRDITIDGYEDGNYQAPSVFTDITEDMTIAREEIFGPVLGLMPAADIDEAIDILNQSRFGNAASLFTGSGSEARNFRHNAEAGNLGVNVGTAAPMAFFHFGGAKDSFFGDLHAQGEDMIQFYTDKTVYIERWTN